MSGNAICYVNSDNVDSVKKKISQILRGEVEVDERSVDLVRERFRFESFANRLDEALNCELDSKLKGIIKFKLMMENSLDFRDAVKQWAAFFLSA